MPIRFNDARVVMLDEVGLLIRYRKRVFRPKKPTVSFVGRKVMVRPASGGGGVLEVEPDLHRVEPWERWEVKS